MEERDALPGHQPKEYSNEDEVHHVDEHGRVARAFFQSNWHKPKLTHLKIVIRMGLSVIFRRNLNIHHNEENDLVQRVDDHEGQADFVFHTKRFLEFFSPLAVHNQLG